MRIIIIIWRNEDEWDRNMNNITLCSPPGDNFMRPRGWNCCRGGKGIGTGILGKDRAEAGCNDTQTAGIQLL